MSFGHITTWTPPFSTCFCPLARVLPDQVHLPTHSKPNTEVPRFAAQKGLFSSQGGQASRWGERISNPPPQRRGTRDIDGPKKQGGLRRGKGDGREGEGEVIGVLRRRI